MEVTTKDHPILAIPLPSCRFIYFTFEYHFNVNRFGSITPWESGTVNNAAANLHPDEISSQVVVARIHSIKSKPILRVLPGLSASRDSFASP